MKLIFALALLLAVVSAAPAPQNFDPEHKYIIIPILRYDEETLDDGGYHFIYETENGITHEASGRADPDANGAIVKEGAYSYPLEDGGRAEFEWTANLGGFIVHSPLLPAIPDFVQEQIDHAERERAAGIIHDGQWDPELYNTGEHDGQWDAARYN